MRESHILHGCGVLYLLHSHTKGVLVCWLPRWYYPIDYQTCVPEPYKQDIFNGEVPLTVGLPDAKGLLREVEPIRPSGRPTHLQASRPVIIQVLGVKAVLR